MQGGVKVYRGDPAAARNYVEADHGHGHAPGHGRADDYYLAEGTGLADRFVATRDGGVEHVGMLDGNAYESWVAGLDPESGTPRGRLRTDAQGVRFVEVVVNGPKSWSLAAAAHPDIAAAYDAAQDAAASQIVGWLAEHATTRVGPRGRQVQVPVERLEAVTVRHYTSRAGDPHRHLHLQVNARVFAAGKWRGLHTVGVRDSIDAINGIGHAAMMTDPAFRQALADHGLSLDPETGEVNELAPFVGAFSARARQIAANIDRYQTEWRDAHPGQEPGPRLYRSWDARAWAQARPDKVIPVDGEELMDRWVTELRALGYRDSRPTTGPTLPVHDAKRPGELDREGAVGTIVSRLAARRSGWNAADIRGEAERLIARANVVTDKPARTELAEDLTARTQAVCVPLLDRNVPEHVRALTSREVLAVEADLTSRLVARTIATSPSISTSSRNNDVARVADDRLDEAQTRVATTLAGDRQLVVVEGAAGAGKTTTLAAASTAIRQRGGRLVVVTPTLKAARVAAREINHGQRRGHAGRAVTRAFSAAWLAYQHGWRWDDDGAWARLPADQRNPRPEAMLQAGDVLLVDEAGMLDQDTARALFTIADETGARLALVGDRHQLPAVGRGGVLDLAVRWTDPEMVLTLDTVRRFTDPDYATITLSMRTGEPLPPHLTGSGDHGDVRSGDVFDALWARGLIRVHASDADRTRALATEAAVSGALVIADTREQVAELNAAIRDHHVTAGRVDDARVVVTDGGERIGTGDTVATRANDYGLGVANRDTWTVVKVTRDGSLRLTGDHGTRTVPAGYVRESVELAYASTVYGAQGNTVSTAHLVLGKHTGAASAYVAMTRGRDSNTAHLVAENLQDTRPQWTDTFARDRADLGPAHAAQLAAQEAAKYAAGRPLETVRGALWRAWTQQADLAEMRGRWDRQRQHLATELPGYRDLAARFPDLAGSHAQELTQKLSTADEKIAEIDHHLDTLHKRLHALGMEPAVVTQPADYLTSQRRLWAEDRADQQAVEDGWAAARSASSGRHPVPPGRFRRPPSPSPSLGDPGSDHGQGIGL